MARRAQITVPDRLRAADAHKARAALTDRAGLRSRALRVALVFGVLGSGFASVGAQLLHLGLQDQPIGSTASMTRPLSQTFSRPDIVDRNGHILATDVVMQSLYADPSELLSASETLEALERVLPGINTPALSRKLSNRDTAFRLDQTRRVTKHSATHPRTRLAGPRL